MLTGRQLYLLRKNETKITDDELSKILDISVNDIFLYEYGKKLIPQNMYQKWENTLKAKRNIVN